MFRQGAAVLWLLLWMLLLAAGFLVYGASGHDDPHINFRFAYTLLEQGEFANHNGERQHHTTSGLQVLLTALLALLLPVQLVTAGYLVDILAALGCCVLVTHLAGRYCRPLVSWPALLMLSSTSFLLWVYGGMGAVLVALMLLLGAFVWTTYVEADDLRPVDYVLLAVTTVAMVLVRPEMPLVMIVATAALFCWHVTDRRRRTRFLQLCLCSSIAAAFLFLLQKAYFGTWLPLPVMAKQTGEFSGKLQAGGHYVLLFSVINPVLLLSLLCTPLLLWQSLHLRKLTRVDAGTQNRNTMALSLLVLLGVYTGFVWTAGGDWMQGGRFVVPVIPVAALLLVMVVTRAVPRPWLARLLLLPLLPFSLYFTGEKVARQNHGVPVWAQYRLDPAHEHYSLFEKYNQEHLRDFAVIDHLSEIVPVLHQQLGRPVRLLSGQSGMVFYKLAELHFGKIRFYDLRGLVEGSFLLCPYLANVERNPMGMGWSYEQFLPRLPELKQHCGIDPPDVVYDLNSLYSSFEPIFEQAGYAMLHQEEGFVIMNPIKAIPTNNLFVPNVIFVRKDLLPLLGNPAKRNVIYRDIRLVNREEVDWLRQMAGNRD